METELARAVDVVMTWAKRIYSLMIKVNKLFSFFSSRCFLKEIKDMYSVFLSSYTNTRESLGELDKAVETFPCGSCSHSISRSPKLPNVFYFLLIVHEERACRHVTKFPFPVFTLSTIVGTLIPETYCTMHDNEDTLNTGTSMQNKRFYPSCAWLMVSLSENALLTLLTQTSSAILFYCIDEVWNGR